MGPDKRRHAEQLFQAALERRVEQRAAFLSSACGDDPSVRAEVESLLAHHDQAAGFLAEPAGCVEVDPSSIALSRSDPDYGMPVVCETLAFSAGQRIGSYRLIKLLGEGGMGVVYLAEQDKPRRNVALKIIRPVLATSAMLRRFEKEAEVLGRLHHPGIAQVFEAGTADSGAGPVPFFAMELVEGQPLMEHAETADLGMRQRLALLVQVCYAVEHAHQSGVIHRDLKPGNILIDATGQPKVLDFGIARITDADVEATTLRTDVGQLIGTVAYMSPEQAAGDPNQLDTRSDVYALGVIAYELLTGRLPYAIEHKRVHEAVRVIREEEPTPLSSVSRVFRGDLQTIVAKALEKDKTRRYASASALAADIERYLGDQPIAARPPSAAYQLRKFARRHRALVAGATGAAVVLLAATAGTTWLALRATAANRRAEAARDAAESVTRFLADMLASVSPEQLGRDVLVKDVLLEASATVGPGFADQPLVEARLRATIGQSYRSLGDLSSAEEHLPQALVLHRSLLGDDHPETLASMNNLAELYADQGRRNDAESLHRQVLEARRRILGAEHPDTLTSMSNLGVTLQLGGRYDEAESLFRHALQARRRVLGERHRSTLVSINNLAVLLKDRGKPSKAEPLLREVLEDRLRLFGDQHPRSLTVMNNLAGVLENQGNLSEAELWYRRALKGRHRHLGEAHPATLISMSNLGLLLQQRGELTEAEPLLRHALDERQRVLGENHSHTLDSMNNFALLLQGKGRLAEAEPLLRKLCRIRRQVDGDDHPKTLSATNNLAFVLWKQGKVEEAEVLCREGLEIRRRVHGEDHPSTLNAINSLATLLLHKEELSEAEALLADAVERAQRILPSDHFRTAMFRSNYGMCLLQLRRYDQAEPHLLESYAALQASLGQNHPRTRETLRHLVQLYEMWNKPECALRWRRIPQTEGSSADHAEKARSESD